MLKDNVVLITNVQHFVGLPTALEMARQGARVICHDVSFAHAAARAAFEKENPGIATTSATEALAVFDDVEKRLGAVDVLVNNDFFPAIRAPVDEASVDDMRRGLEALLIAPFQFSGAAAVRMKLRKQGKIILVTSAAPIHGLPNYSMYVAARGAANALTVTLAKELAPFNINVNAVAPNYVESESYFPAKLRNDPDFIGRMASKVPLKRLGKPEEVAGVIAFLASPAAGFMTGHVLPFAGGWA
tara:strand:+ start:385 stop:1116 length:732 start_codon:yes stop_codon:yes gene_type:complete